MFEPRIEKVKDRKERFMMFKCPTCKTAKDVWYDTKGGYCNDDIYTCLKCGYSFIVSAICNKCDTPHSRAYGCNSPNCNSENYHYDHKQEEIGREF